jgi:carboxylate-amine ligase
MGVEEEFQILDPETGDLVSRADEIMGKAGKSYEENLKSELFQAVVETASDICRDIDEVREEVLRLRRGLSEVFEEKGYRMAAAGTHPWARWEDQKMTDKQRYRDLLDEIRWPAKRELIFGQHVHVAIPHAGQAIYVNNHIRPFLPVILALSANSPFWRGEATGLMSTRVRIFDAMPRTGLPRAFDDYADFAETIERFKAGGSIEDITRIWWDVRPRPDLGTVEVRMADLPTEAETSIALPALVQSLVVRLGRAWKEGEDPPVRHKPEVIEENRWRALRGGLDTHFIQYANVGQVEQIPVRDAVLRTLDHLGDVPEELGVTAEIDHLRAMVENGGTDADRQLEVYDRTGELIEVVRDIAERTVP